jgi:Lrp/AsnC family transcriptional regulator for asnA, asnC and gidA
MLKYLDQYDYKIIVRLLQDGRATFSNIAKDLGITDVAVKKRFERLVSKGIIRKISVDVDYAQIGIGGELIVFLKVDPVIEDKAVMILKEDDFVKTAYRTVGDYNIVFIYLLKDLTQLQNIDKLVAKIKGTLDFKFLFVNEKVYDKQSIPLSSLQVYYR